MIESLYFDISKISSSDPSDTFIAMHISSSKIAFSPEEIFNYLQAKDPLVWKKVIELICGYADELYASYPGSKLPTSPVAEGIQFKDCGVPIFFEANSANVAEPVIPRKCIPLEQDRRLSLNRPSRYVG